MTTRREAAAAHRRAKHSALVGSATTATARLWRACNWLIAEAKHHGRLTETLTVIHYLIDLLRDGKPLPGPPNTLTEPDGGAPRYLRVRAASDPKDVA